MIEAGVAGPIKSCGCPTGTVMEVRNLFFNIPVRRTFLKSDTTEAGHVAETFSRIALAHPQIHLTFRSGGKIVHDLPQVTGMRERIAIFFGRELAESLLWVESRLDKLTLWGYVAHPSQSRSSTKGQFLFLGGRYVRDRSLGHALGEAYRGLLMVGRNPVAFLHLEVPPEEVDVNVHPTKIEVRFRDPQRVYSHLLSTLRQTFLASDLHTRLQAAQEPPVESTTKSGRSGSPEGGGGIPGGTGAAAVASGTSAAYELSGRAPDRQAVASWFTPGPAAATFTIPDSVGRVEPPEWSRSLPGQFEFAAADAFDEFGGGPAAQSPSPSPSRDVTDNSLPPQTTLTPAREGRQDSALAAGPLKAIQVHDSYLIAETKDGMMVIDQHALARANSLRRTASADGRRQGRIAGAARPRAGASECRRGCRDPRAPRAFVRAWTGR